MRKLLNTLYITSEDLFLSYSNDNVVVNRGDEITARFPLLNLEGIITFSYAGATPSLMGECAKRNIQLTFMTPNGRFLARVNGMSQGNVLLRREQYRIADSNARSCLIARNMITGKAFNSRWVLERALRDHALRIDQHAVNAASEQIQQLIQQIRSVAELDSLRGLEGEAAAAYFGVFDELILSQKVDFIFDGRNRRPPQDNVNAMLSFAYTLLANDCAAALESVGLDAYVGFLHQDRPGRKSLALDLEEELRAPFADRLVLTLINNRIIQDKHFDRQEGGTVLLNDNGRKLFLKHWQEKKRDEITHPFLKEKMPWGLVPYVQSLLLARCIRGDIDEYPPFLWK
ncbi:MAG: type I-C CRISPR-associated endonuclease Cas1 [Clostridia bacterium]|nr:type I-C CRISPR-associated endonuclease Cas1 [Clostridia bacterium]